MRLATWNLNNRVGKVRFRPEAAAAALALNADLIVLTEFYPQQHQQRFCQELAESGLPHQLLSHQPPEIANRTLIASRIPLVRDDLILPAFDHQFPANTVAAFLPSVGLRILGLRVPAYEAKHCVQLLQSWTWLEVAAATLREAPAVIMGDLNVGVAPKRKGAGESFLRILECGWQRAVPSGGHSFLGHSGKKSEIDHVLCNSRCVIHRAEYVTQASNFALAGTPGAISDHAALVATIDVRA